MEKWWESSNPHEAIFAVVDNLSKNQGFRNEDYLRNIRLYGNLDILGLSNTEYFRPANDGLSNRVTFNVIQSCVDTAVAKITKNRPKPRFLTEGGDYSLQKKAKLLDQFTEGLFFKANLYEKSAKAFLDACVTGTGAVKIYPCEGDVFADRKLPGEIMVDDRDAMYGTPRTIYEAAIVPKEVLIAMYPKSRFDIEQSIANMQLSMFNSNRQESEHVLVVEAWHLPSSKEAKDGKHVIAISNGTLFKEDYTRDSFPFAFIRWNERINGFFGQGISEQLTGIQIEINKLLRNIQTAHHLLSAPAVLVEQGSKVLKTHLNNEIGRIITYMGTKPSIDVFQTIHPEIYQHLERLYMKAFELVGISQLSAQSKKPGGLDSGKALREFNDIETERFANVGLRWEKFHMDIARLMVDEAQKLYAEDKSFSVKVKGKDFLKTIPWKEIDLDETDYQMHVWPVSLLPSTPSGKLATVQDLMAAQLIDGETGMELLEFPDLQRFTDLKFAAKNLIKDIVERILEKDEYTSPEPFMDLAYAVSYTQTVYNKAKLDNVPEETLELLRRFIEQANDMLQPQSPPQAAMPEQGMEPAIAPEMPLEALPQP